MKAVNEMRMNFESRSCNESFARSAVAAFIAVLDPNVEELSDIKTAVSEAVTNSIVHGYKENIGKSESIKRFKTKKEQVEAVARQDHRVYPGEVVFVFPDKDKK